MEKHFLILLDRIIESKIKITLHCPEGFEINKVTLEVAKKMKKAGFEKINLALESVDEEMLKRFHKPIKSMDLKGAVKNLRSAGIDDINVFLLVGLPGQTLASIVRSYVYVWRQKCDIVFMPFSPIPGTIEYQNHYDLIKNKDLEELHPILLSCANDNLKIKNLYQLAMFEHTSSPEPMIYHISELDPGSEIIELILKYYYNDNRRKLDNFLKKYKPKDYEIKKLEEAKKFFERKIDQEYF